MSNWEPSVYQVYSKNCLELERYFLCSKVTILESQIDGTGWNSEILCQVQTTQSTTDHKTESSTKATSHSDTSSTAELTTEASTVSTTKPTEAITVPTSQPTTALTTEQMLFINAITHNVESVDDSSSPTRYEVTYTTESLKAEDGRPLLKEDTQDNPRKPMLPGNLRAATWVECIACLETTHIITEKQHQGWILAYLLHN